MSFVQTTQMILQIMFQPIIHAILHIIPDMVLLNESRSRLTWFPSEILKREGLVEISNLSSKRESCRVDMRSALEDVWTLFRGRVSGTSRTTFAKNDQARNLVIYLYTVR